MTTLQFSRPAFKQLDSVMNELIFGTPANKAQAFSVPANILETAESYELTLLAPGRNKEDYRISLEKGLLTISYTAPQETETKPVFIRREFILKDFSRSFTLDDKIDSTNISASYENGLLKLVLPRKAEPANEIKKIDIQ